MAQTVYVESEPRVLVQQIYRPAKRHAAGYVDDAKRVAVSNTVYRSPGGQVAYQVSPRAVREPEEYEAPQQIVLRSPRTIYKERGYAKAESALVASLDGQQCLQQGEMSVQHISPGGECVQEITYAAPVRRVVEERPAAHQYTVVMEAPCEEDCYGNLLQQPAQVKLSHSPSRAAANFSGHPCEGYQFINANVSAYRQPQRAVVRRSASPVTILSPNGLVYGYYARHNELNYKTSEDAVQRARAEMLRSPTK